jgi:hypothetical protein
MYLALGTILFVFICDIASGSIPLGGMLDDQTTSLIYDPFDGNLRFEGAGKSISTMELLSSAAFFQGPDSGCEGLRQPNRFLCEEIRLGNKLFISDTVGLKEYDFGRVLVAGLAGEVLAGDLIVNGSVLPAGALDLVDLIIVPEPSASLYVIGIAVVEMLRRQIRTSKKKQDISIRR